MRTQQVECIIFCKDKDQFKFLLLKRIPEKGSFWQPACGGIESTDTSLLDGAYREIKEETGITKNQIIRVIEKVHEFTMHNDYLTGKASSALTEYAFGFEVLPDTKVNLHSNTTIEHEEYKWVNFEEAIKLLKWEDNKNAFKALYKKLNN